MKRLVLIDANALIHRGYHALPPLKTKKGELVNAVYGFTAVLLKVLKELKPDYILTAFDLPKPTFRHLEYAEYKATRPKTPDELVQQFPLVKKVVKALDIPILEKEGFEADDIIGTITKKTGKDIEDIVVTGVGIVSPVGLNLKESWENIVAGKSGVVAIDEFDTTDFAVKIAATVKNFDASHVIPKKDLKKMDTFIHYGLVAADEALRDSGHGAY